MIFSLIIRDLTIGQLIAELLQQSARSAVKILPPLGNRFLELRFPHIDLPNRSLRTGILIIIDSRLQIRRLVADSVRELLHELHNSRKVLVLGS
jgi:hypothetical protein